MHCIHLTNTWFGAPGSHGLVCQGHMVWSARVTWFGLPGSHGLVHQGHMVWSARVTWCRASLLTVCYPCPFLLLMGLIYWGLALPGNWELTSACMGSARRMGTWCCWYHFLTVSGLKAGTVTRWDQDHNSDSSFVLSSWLMRSLSTHHLQCAGGLFALVVPSSDGRCCPFCMVVMHVMHAVTCHLAAVGQYGILVEMSCHLSGNGLGILLYWWLWLLEHPGLIVSSPKLYLALFCWHRMFSSMWSVYLWSAWCQKSFPMCHLRC